MKIPPVFKITEKTRNYLNVINIKSVILKQEKIDEKKWQRLTSESLLKSSLYSAKIEGNKLEYKDISRRLSPKKLEQLEIRNLIRALKYIKKNVRPRQKISTKFLARLHAIAMKNVNQEAGKIRTQQNAIFDSAGFVVYMPPPPEEAKKLLKRLVRYIKSSKNSDLPVVKAIVVHYLFEKIHPFLDGNGRVGRLLIYAILRIYGSELPSVVSFEEKLNLEKEDYYYFLSENSEATSFVEFMTEIISAAASDAAAKIHDIKEKDSLLLPRREEIFNIVREHKIVSVDFLHRRFQNINERTIRNDLEDLIRKKLIKKIGATKGAAYKIL